MAYTFQAKNVAKITATVDGTTDRIAVYGVTPDENLTPAEAKTQLDKVLGIVGKSVKVPGMARNIYEEAVDNG